MIYVCADLEYVIQVQYITVFGLYVSVYRCLYVVFFNALYNSVVIIKFCYNMSLLIEYCFWVMYDILYIGSNVYNMNEFYLYIVYIVVFCVW